jgi:carbamoyltransferase
MSRIYSFYGGIHDASVCFFENGELKVALQEERISRIKEGDGDYSFPLLSFQKIQEITGVGISEADYVCTSTPTLYPYITENLEGVSVREFPHHYCHAVSTYYTSGFSGKCLMLSYDGGGDGNYGEVWLCENGEMERVMSMPSHSFSSIANLWSLATIFLGWRAHQDEGKVMGMSANGEDDEFLRKIIYQILTVEVDGVLSLTNPGTDLFSSFVFQHLENSGLLNSQKGRENFAKAVQSVTEELMVSFVKELHGKYPEHCRKIGLSGGLFHNVKMNQKINELDFVDEVYVVPFMGDEGVSFGAGLAMSRILGEVNQPFKLKHCFYGIDYPDSYIVSLLASRKEFSWDLANLDTVSDLLVSGNVIGLFNGKFEYGARALGARSIICNPSDPEMHEKLNNKLGRNQVMPFAPAVLSEFSESIFYHGNKSKYSAEFMTICYTVREEWQEKISACFHRVDKTARPQLVNKETNTKFWEIIESFRKKTGIPALLNTSFNGHGQPIIDSPEQALEHLQNGTIDFLILGSFLVNKKKQQDEFRFEI